MRPVHCPKPELGSFRQIDPTCPVPSRPTIPKRDRLRSVKMPQLNRPGPAPPVRDRKLASFRQFDPTRPMPSRPTVRKRDWLHSVTMPRLNRPRPAPLVRDRNWLRSVKSLQLAHALTPDRPKTGLASFRQIATSLGPCPAPPVRDPELGSFRQFAPATSRATIQAGIGFVPSTYPLRPLS